jgi:coiled-coil domain-containing protein 55
MNIDLSKAASMAANEKKRGPSLSMGLNPRQQGGGNVFQTTGDDDDDSSSSSHDEKPLTGRKAVNQQISREQAAVRERALTASTAPDSVDPQIYDYDGAYDSFSQQPTAVKGSSSSRREQQDAAGSERKSRYIGDLMKNAEKRKIERDIIYERKVAREQEAEENLDPECRGKERFVTAAYKRKLEERKVWQQEEERQQKQEEDNDVTKQSHGVAAFYGNWNRNIAMGGGETFKANNRKKDDDGEEEDITGSTAGMGFLQGFEKVENNNHILNETKQQTGATTREINEDDPKERRKQMRLLREQKIDQARTRYFERQKRLIATAGATAALVSE